MVSIIIPTFNEENNITPMLKQLTKLNGKFEVIFSDGNSTDKTFAKIRGHKKINIAKYRSNQMNEAAKIAKGDYLWFLHVDSKIDKDSVLEIEKSGVDVGCFKVEFDSNHILMKIIAFNSNNRVRFRNIAFGDQGIFIKRNLFFEIGGYKKIALMEDYQLSMDIKSMGKKIKLLNKKIITSSRKFKKEGIIKTVIRMQYFQHKYRRNSDVYTIYKEYYGEKDDTKNQK